ncbi:hypothetical protein NSMM_190023 [Nitrosomonas mobilis]|uniref:Uncharacterized protein n=1 Tax=Nitrosomonas mobilis TaxID=51642 RepID=A0A1G5SBF6_9PROT|nr:hypothetical protein NSMM_190023 [Nitrosomonas mobilis]
MDMSTGPKYNVYYIVLFYINVHLFY